MHETTPLVDIKQLRYFIAIAEEGSLSAASQRLRVAQPSLSQHVIKIEQELGVTLVHRSPRGVVLTPSGEILLRHAREICQSMAVCQESVRKSGGVLEGSVAFGLPSSVSMVLSVPLAETVRLTLPKVKFRVIEAMSGFIRDWLQEETIDLGFLYDPGDSKLFEAREVLQEELYFYAAADNWPLPGPPGGEVALAELAGLDLVLPSQQHGLRRTIETYARDRGVELEVGLEMDALSQIKELVVRGSGYTILAPAAAHDRFERGELVASRIIDPVMTRSVYIVRKLTHPQSFICREVERVTDEVMRDLARRGIWKASRNLLTA
ncbi:MAG: LysR family transcriptional regulator [Roseiarcus sp.]